MSASNRFAIGALIGALMGATAGTAAVLLGQPSIPGFAAIGFIAFVSGFATLAAGAAA